MRWRLHWRRRVPPALAAGLALGLAAWPLHLAARADFAGRSVDAVLKDTLLLLQGDVVTVHASAALCGSAQPSSTQELMKWYFADTGCNLLYAPRPSALVSPVTEGEGKRLSDSADLRARLAALLDELHKGVGAKPPSLQQKLQVHSTAWEISFGLRQSIANHPEWQESLAPLVARSVALLTETAFSERESTDLPDNLARLPKAAGVPEIEPTVASLLRHDPGFFEIATPSDLHADALLGRFTPRIVLTADDPAGRDELKKWTADRATPPEQFRELPQVLGNVRAILILYFNVFAGNGTILPTHQVAAWLEYSFAGKTSFKSEFAEVANRIRFRVIEYRRVPGGPAGEPVYELLDQNQMARRGFVDAKPLLADMSVTTLRGSCLVCHRYQIATFDTHGARRSEFSPPLLRAGREILTPFYQKFERGLGEMKQQYKAGGAESVIPPSEPGR